VWRGGVGGRGGGGGGGGGLMQTSALFSTKNVGFFDIYGVSARTRGVEPVRTFSGQGGVWVNFSQFCVDVIYGYP